MFPKGVWGGLPGSERFIDDAKSRPTRTGCKIQHLSALPEEAEVLLLPNFKAIVTKGLCPIEETDDASKFVF